VKKTLSTTFALPKLMKGGYSDGITNSYWFLKPQSIKSESGD